MSVRGRASAARRAAATFLALASICGACSGGGSVPSTPTPRASDAPGPQGAAPRPVVIDTDMAVDDWLAILYLLGRPEVSVEAITVTGTGEAHCGPGVEHALGLAALAGQPDIPVACGRETPLAGSHAFPDEWRIGVDGLLGLSLPRNANEPRSVSSVELLAETLRASPDPVALLTLGPLTNPAELLRDQNDLGGRVSALFAMGGAVDVDGNVGVSGVGIDNRFAEWNVYVDPLAADLVLQSGVPVTLVPLDATNDAPVTTAFTDRLAVDATTPVARFAHEVLTAMGGSIQSGSYYFWDPLAAALIVDETLGSFETRAIAVVTDEGPESGRVVASAGARATRFATSADTERFEQLLLDTWNGRAP